MNRKRVFITGKCIQYHYVKLFENPILCQRSERQYSGFSDKRIGHEILITLYIHFTSISS